jgi:hypothetical protein
MRCFEIIQSK